MKGRQVLVWLLMFALIITSFPIQPTPGVLAADAQDPVHFIPNNSILRGTHKFKDDNESKLDYDNVYRTASRYITIDGSYNRVKSETLRVKVENLIKDGNKWVVTQSSQEIGVTVLSEYTFIVNNLELYPGYNRITFYGIGMDNSLVEEPFYVLFEDGAHILEAYIPTAGSQRLYLNIGTAVVVTTDQISVQGTAPNARRMSINGTQVYVTDYDERFFSPPIQLQPGLNELNFVIETATDRLEEKRFVYYFRPNDPFSKLDLTIDTETHSVLNASQPPTFYVGTGNNTATLEFEVLIPAFEGITLENNAKITVTESVYVGWEFDVVDSQFDIETYLGAGDQVYYLVKPKDGQLKLDRTSTSGGGEFPLGLNSLSLNIVYPTGADPDDQIELNRDIRFFIGENRVGIQNIYYVPDGVAPNEASTPLNGLTIPSDKINIVVQTNKPLSGEKLKVRLASGLSDYEINVTGEKNEGNNKYSYTIENIPEGTQRLIFQYNDGPEYQVTVNYSTNLFIFLETIADGQVFEVNSANPANYPKKLIKGRIVGLKDNNAIKGFVITVNGKEVTVNKNFPEFDTTVPFGDPGDGNGFFITGENTIEFKLIYYDVNDYRRKELTKVIKVYFFDTNIPTIEKVLPVPVPTGTSEREPIDGNEDRIIFNSSDFYYRDNRYYTTNEIYDLVIKGNSAKKVIVARHGEELFEHEISQGKSANTVNNSPIGPVHYEIYMNNGTFILRIHDLEFDGIETHIYTITLQNETGARATHTIEIEREYAPFVIISPQPTVGEKYIYNKNYVRFDIQADGADEVLIGKEKAEPHPTIEGRFVYDYIGLRPNRDNKIDITVRRGSTTIKDSINIYYVDTVGIGSQVMEKMDRRHRVLDRSVELTFPRGTVLKTVEPIDSVKVTKYYTDQYLLFGIADPTDGVVERVTDYGKKKDRDIARDAVFESQFLSQINRQHFTRVSPVYWISGGLAEFKEPGEQGYLPPRHGITPYTDEGLSYRELLSMDVRSKERKLVPTNRGTLTLAFDPNVVDEAGTHVTVFRLTDKGNGIWEWENIGGEVNTKNNTITVPFDEFGYYMVMKLRYGFEDVTNHNWARNILEALFSKGFMDALRYDQFGVHDYATRGEFAQVLVKALNLELNYDDNNTFIDVPPGSRGITWEYKYIETAARAGIITGEGTRVFNPEGRLTREQAATMVARALELRLQTNDDRLMDRLTKQFTDATDIRYYARPAVQAVVQAGIMQGRPNPTQAGERRPTYHFAPQANLTRAEMGQIAVRMVQRHSNVFPKNLN